MTDTWETNNTDLEEKHGSNRIDAKIRRTFDALKNRFAGTADGEFKDWQVTMFFLIFLCTTIFNTISCSISVVLMIIIEKYQVAVFYLLVYALFLLVTFGKFLEFKTRVFTGLCIYYCLGLINLIQIGPVGSGKTWLFAFALVACLILGLKPGIWALVINSVTFIIIGYLLKAGVIFWHYSPTIQLYHWSIACVTYIVICATIMIPLSIIVSFREKRLIDEIRMTDRLRKLNMQFKQEIVERKLIEKALTESEEKFSKAFKTSPAVMAIISVEDMCIVEVNYKFEEIFGYTSENIIGQPVGNLNIWLDEKDREIFQNTIRKQNTVKNVEISLFKKNGDIFQGLFSADQVTLKGKPYFLSILVDISDIKKSEKELKQNNVYLGQVVGLQSKELCRVKFELDKTKALAAKLLSEVEDCKKTIR